MCIENVVKTILGSRRMLSEWVHMHVGEEGLEIYFFANTLNECRKRGFQTKRIKAECITDLFY
jgi:hypothetical protein